MGYASRAALKAAAMRLSPAAERVATDVATCPKLPSEVASCHVARSGTRAALVALVALASLGGSLPMAPLGGAPRPGPPPRGRRR